MVKNNILKLLLGFFLILKSDFCYRYTNNPINIGINLAYYQNRKFNEEDKNFINYLAKKGIKHIAIHWTFYQDSLNSDSIYMHSYKTMSFEFVDSLIKELRKYNMEILLKPAIDVLTEESRTKINPKNQEKWFKNYENLILTLAKYAEEKKIEIFSVGVELDNLVEKYKEKFYDIAKKIKEVYKGKIIYCANVIYKRDLENLLVIDIPSIDAYFLHNDIDSLRFYFSLMPSNIIISEFGFKEGKDQEKNFRNFLKVLRQTKKVSRAYLWNIGKFKIINKNKKLEKIIFSE